MNFRVTIIGLMSILLTGATSAALEKQNQCPNLSGKWQCIERESDIDQISKLTVTQVEVSNTTVYAFASLNTEYQQLSSSQGDENSFSTMPGKKVNLFQVVVDGTVKSKEKNYDDYTLLINQKSQCPNNTLKVDTTSIKLMDHSSVHPRYKGKKVKILSESQLITEVIGDELIKTLSTKTYALIDNLEKPLGAISKKSTCNKIQ